MKNTFLDYRDTVNKYLNVTDWRVKENSTVTYSVGGLILSNSGAITANYWLSEVYDDEIANAHRTCNRKEANYPVCLGRVLDFHSDSNRLCANAGLDAI